MTWETKKTVTPKEYFLLASHKFPERGSFVEDWAIAKTQTLYKHGVIATCFQNDKLMQIVIAFHVVGTDTISQEGVDFAHDFVDQVKVLSQELGYSVSYTGQYSGAAIAEICSMQDKLPCYSFNSASIIKDEYNHQF